jgi:hypothetical protein
MKSHAVFAILVAGVDLSVAPGDAKEEAIMMGGGRLLFTSAAQKMKVKKAAIARFLDPLISVQP